MNMFDFVRPTHLISDRAVPQRLRMGYLLIRFRDDEDFLREEHPGYWRDVSDDEDFAKLFLDRLERQFLTPSQRNSGERLAASYARGGGPDGWENHILVSPPHGWTMEQIENAVWGAFPFTNGEVEMDELRWIDAGALYAEHLSQSRFYEDFEPHTLSS